MAPDDWNRGERAVTLFLNGEVLASAPDLPAQIAAGEEITLPDRGMAVLRRA